MILAIDCGNTLVKWGMRAAGESGWRRQGAVPLGREAELAPQWSSLASPDAVIVANVAGAQTRAALEGLLARFDAPVEWAASRGSQCGVTNAYERPAQLGVDRWAALIAARSLQPGACVVVCAGTATTIDLLGANGTFRGGVILPGLELMKESLAARTAGLPLARGEFVAEPRNTADAIETGCLLAQAGAIERLHASLDRGATCLISGGAALRIAARLSMSVRVVDNLVLEGLVRMAQSGEAPR